MSHSQIDHQHTHLLERFDLMSAEQQDSITKLIDQLATAHQESLALSLQRDPTIQISIPR